MKLTIEVILILWNSMCLIKDLDMISTKIIEYEAEKELLFTESILFEMWNAFILIIRVALRGMYSYFVFIVTPYIWHKSLGNGITCFAMALIFGIGLWKSRIINIL